MICQDEYYTEFRRLFSVVHFLCRDNFLIYDIFRFEYDIQNSLCAKTQGDFMDKIC